MPFLWLFLIVIAIAAIGYVLGRSRALQSAQGDSRNLHSLPNFYGANVALKTVVPAFGLLILWLLVQPLFVNSQISGMIPETAVKEGSSIDLVMAEVRRTAAGLDAAVAQGQMTEDVARSATADIAEVTQSLKDAGQVVTSEITQPVLAAAQQYRAMTSTGYGIMSIAVILVALVGAGVSWWQTHADYRARNVVEQGVRVLLLGAASIAILTTVGIVLSLVFNTWEFFRLYPATDFFFGTTWAPSFSGRGGASDLGIIPLLWGTFYISLVALLVAVPIGLFAAIYLSEYASPRVRSVAKPLLEVLAGIPTIVYGLFALLTVGPLLLGVFGDDGRGWMKAGPAEPDAGLPRSRPARHP